MDDEDEPRGYNYVAWGDVGALALGGAMSLLGLFLIVDLLLGGHPLAPLFAHPQAPPIQGVQWVSAPMHLAPGEVELSTGAAMPPRAADTTFPPIQDVASLKIALRRTLCFGTCPDYSVQISGDGTVAYQGNECVAQKGERAGRTPPEQVAALVQMFRDARFFSLPGRFAASITDNPTTTVSISFDGKSKTVVDYAGRLDGMPQAVTALETAIDKAAGTDAWIFGGKRSCNGQPIDDSGRNTQHP